MNIMVDSFGQRQHADQIARGTAVEASAAPAAGVRPPAALDYGDYDDSGVDLSLLRYMLGLSPLERLMRMEEHARDTLVLYEYGRQHRQAKAAAHR
jgi:hypothetical protein